MINMKNLSNILLTKDVTKYQGITEYFLKYFIPVLANTDQLKQEVYKIRYEVYCKELKYEPKDKFPDKKERDIYDDQSYHFLLKHKPTEQYVGCVRLIFATPKHSQALFPFERVYDNSINLVINSRQNYCEISRLAILKTFRKPQKNTLSALGVNFCSQDEKYNMPLICMGLHGIYISMAAFWRVKLFCLIEDSLARHYRRYGITTYKIGPMLDYHGKRTLFLMKPREIMKNIDPNLSELFQTIQQELLSSTPSLSLVSA